MEAACKWGGLPTGPSLKHLTEPGYGFPKKQQVLALQELTRAHIDSFNHAVGEGLHLAVQVRRLAGLQCSVCL
uniref:Uncharacterized protein n=1 Tax=Sphenodon punctatus TaxID=8508 RepID=A0A8D0HFD5_SPHPU